MRMFFLTCVYIDSWGFLLFRDESSAHFVPSIYCITTSWGAALEVACLLLKGYSDAPSSVSKYAACGRIQELLFIGCVC